MEHRSPPTARRRTIITSGLAAMALGLTGQRQASARAIFLRGMSGGGLAQLEETATPMLANFGLFASAMQRPDGTTVFLGIIQWIEAGTDLRLESIEISQCIPMEGRTDGAQIRGRMMANGEGNYPFVIHAFDAGRPGSGLDRLELSVNTATAQEDQEPPEGDATFIYEVAATLVAGNLQWIIADVEVEG